MNGTAKQEAYLSLACSSTLINLRLLAKCYIKSVQEGMLIVTLNQCRKGCTRLATDLNVRSASILNTWVAASTSTSNTEREGEGEREEEREEERKREGEEETAMSDNQTQHRHKKGCGYPAAPCHWRHTAAPSL